MSWGEKQSVNLGICVVSHQLPPISFKIRLMPDLVKHIGKNLYTII